VAKGRRPAAAELALRAHVERGEGQRAGDEERDVDDEELLPADPVADHDGRYHEERQHEHQQVRDVVRQVKERLRLDPPREPAPQDRGQQLAARLERALGPAPLLALEAVDVDGTSPGAVQSRRYNTNLQPRSCAR
jgi:hypothetical protein